MARQLEHFPNLVTMFLTRVREKGDAPFLWATYLAWHVLARQNKFGGPLPAFELDAQQVEVIADDDDQGADDVDPTRTGREPG